MMRANNSASAAEFAPPKSIPRDASVSDRKTEVLAHLLSERLAVLPKDILGVGGGSGREAGILARHFKSRVIGIDILSEHPFDEGAAAPAVLQVMDAQSMSFPDQSFDLVYSFHALEHIPDCRAALCEMHRVLRVGGAYCVGTPNKSRLIGSIGSPESLYYKILWNFHDIGMRLRRQWSNEAGAHAGFGHKELVDLCQQYLGPAESLTDEYYRQLYGGGTGARARALAALLRSSLRRVVLPCVYVFGRKNAVH
jgi:ubiquinone/menaquinone biosynthesis C-methylase UbiE